MIDTTGFLKEIYKNCDEGLLSLVTLPKCELFWFETSQIEAAAKKAIELGKITNTYFGIGLRREKLPHNIRGGEDDVSCVTVLYCDIDVKGPAHVEENLPESKEQAVELLNSLPLKPSIIVWSGNGIHAYWLLDKPFMIKSPGDKAYISGMVSGWGKYINEQGRQRGWKIDNVYDLARILRVPGTTNQKKGRKQKCVMVEASCTRYSLSGFEGYRIDPPVITERADMENVSVGEASRIIEKCAFVKYCKDNAAKLPEPLWHAMVTNISLAKDGAEAVHELSKPYPQYDKTETDEKIKRAINQNKPHSCQYIKDSLGYCCPEDCGIKAPVVFCVLTKEEQISALLAEEFTDLGDVFSERVLDLMAYAKSKLPSEYAKFKLKIKGKVGFRDFDNALSHRIRTNRNERLDKSDKLLDTQKKEHEGFIQPSGWDATLDEGIRKYVSTKDGTIIAEVCPSMILISRRLENLDDDTEKVEITFYRNGRWKTFLASRSQVFNKATLVRFSDSGLPVSSDTCADIVKYLSDFENANIGRIPLVKSISRVGWVNTQFFPYATREEVVYETDFKESNDIVMNMNKTGDYELWKGKVMLARENFFARFLIAASFASPLLELLGHRVFFVHIWHDSKSGKTAALKTGVSVWGNPLKLMGSFNATPVGLERMAGTLKHLPFAIDELQVLNERRLSAENIIYGLSNGFGRIRGAKEGGVQDMVTWRNIILTSGEEPLSKEASNDGVITRVLELYGKPVDDEDFARQMHLLSENNYAHAGEEYINYIIKENIINKSQLRSEFASIMDEIAKIYGSRISGRMGSHLDNISLVCLGDYYSSIGVFKVIKQKAWEEAVNLGVSVLENNKQLERADTVTRAWEFVVGWIIANRTRFENSATPCYGITEGRKHYVLPAYLKEALETNGFDYSKVTRGFKDRGLIETVTDCYGVTRMHLSKRVNGVLCKVIVVELDTDIEETIPLIGKKE